jgi:uncharacterized protein YndB with AHSA1/START domain
VVQRRAWQRGGVQVCSDRSFTFAVPPEVLWSVIADVGSYRRWWPWLRGFEAVGLVTGDVWRCEVSPPLPYVLSFTVTLDDVEAHRFVAATVRGDIEGSATLEVRPCGDGAEARLVSALAPRNPVLRAAAVVAGPLVRYGHDWVLDTGARQLVARAL